MLYTISVVPLEIDSFDVDNNTMSPGQLQSVVFRSFPRTENEIAIIKFILACSPLLKKIYIHYCNLSHDENEKIKMNWELARRLLKLHRSSPTAGVEFFYCF